MTSVDSLQTIFKDMKVAYNNAPYPSFKSRVNVLRKLKTSLLEHEDKLYEALKKDYGYRSEFDTLIADILPTVSSINYALKHLKKWMKPSKRHAGLLLAPSSVYVHYQPLGVVGVITPWNFPVFLALGPAVQALAAGNRVMVKMSEFTPHTNKALRMVLEPIAEYIRIVEGEADVGAAFSAIPFDHLIFTGSTVVGKHVAKAAADNLTPITLELGGKSPTIIDEQVDMSIAVDALIVGKSINSGQICVAPDYIFVPSAREAEFVDTFKKLYAEYHVETNTHNTQTHIVSDRQMSRLKSILDDATDKGAKVHAVKEYNDGDDRLIYPQILTDVSDDMLAMKEEIFGSVLPVMTYENIEEVFDYINKRARPLALYIMSSDDVLIERILKNTHSGGVSINDTVMHVAADDAPFGGVGHSGMGHYHGHEGFLTFSKAKTVVRSSAWLPKNRYILKNRDVMFKLLRKFFLR